MPGDSQRIGSEAMYRLMRAFLALAQRVIQRYAGTLMQRFSDGFMACFGAPWHMKIMLDGRCWQPSSCSSALMKSLPCVRHYAAYPLHQHGTPHRSGYHRPT